MTSQATERPTIKWIEKNLEETDRRGLTIALIVLIIGGVVIALTVERKSAGVPITGLLFVSAIFYGVISKRITEFAAPGGWSAKFIETAQKSIRNTDAVFHYTPVDVNFQDKGTLEESMQRLVALHDDIRPLVLTLNLGIKYESESFAALLTAFATVPNFRGVAVLSNSGALIAYSSARQISWLSSIHCDVARSALLQYVENNDESKIIKHISMSSVRVTNGSSYIYVLNKALEKNLTCIAVVDEDNKLCGIVDIDRLAAALVLSVALSVQGGDVKSDHTDGEAPTAI